MMAVKYALFAGFAILLNLLSQVVSFTIYNGFLSLYIAMLVGTAVGLVAKYILDKNYIFYHKSLNKAQNIKKFSLYSLTGIITTLIFWTVEISFDIIFSYNDAKYYGAVTGLSIGYILKYFLDKKYVFKN